MGAFLSDEQYDIIKQTAEATNTNMLDVLSGIRTDSDAYEAFIGIAFDDSSQAVGKAFKAVRDLMVKIEREASAALDRRSTFRDRTSRSVYATSRDPASQKRIEGFYNMLGIGPSSTQAKYNGSLKFN